MSFGAFVNILPGKDGMVHVSDMGQTGFVKDASDVVHIGQKVQVRVKKIDDMGRINLSMNLDPAKDAEIDAAKAVRGPRRDGGDRGGFGGGRGGFSRGGFGRGGSRFAPRGASRDRGFGGRRNFDRPDRGPSGGPHFPTTRLMGEEKKSFDR